MNRFVVEDNDLMPRRKTLHSAGYDFIAPHDIFVKAHSESDVIDTGVSVELDKGNVLMLYVRSSYGFKYGITLSNGTGVIDSDFYPNKMKCKLRNDSDNDFTIKNGESYMQGVIISYIIADNEIKPIENRVGGIGSTGR